MKNLQFYVVIYHKKKMKWWICLVYLVSFSVWGEKWGGMGLKCWEICWEFEFSDWKSLCKTTENCIFGEF